MLDSISMHSVPVYIESNQVWGWHVVEAHPIQFVCAKADPNRTFGEGAGERLGSVLSRLPKNLRGRSLRVPNEGHACRTVGCVEGGVVVEVIRLASWEWKPITGAKGEVFWFATNRRDGRKEVNLCRCGWLIRLFSSIQLE